MNRNFVIAFLGSILFLFIVICLSVYSYNSNREISFQVFPELVVSDLFSGSVNLKDHATDVPSVLIYFNSSCPICQSEAELIERSFREDTITRFLWVSSEPASSILTGGLVNEGVSEKASQFVNRAIKIAKEEKYQFDAINYSSGKKIIAVK